MALLFNYNASDFCLYSIIYLSPVANIYNRDKKYIIIYFINYTIVTNTQAKGIIAWQGFNITFKGQFIDSL